MEKWQRDCITKQLGYLVENIECNTMLISFLTQYGILAKCDVVLIVSFCKNFTLISKHVIIASFSYSFTFCDDKTTRGRNLGQHDQTKLLLDTLMTRKHGYESLARALFQTKQTGSLIKLLKHVEQNFPDSNPFKVCGIIFPREQVLEQHFIFDNIRLPLNEICGILKAEDVTKIITENMSISIFEQILNKTDIPLSISTIPNSVSYYVPRSIIVQTEVDKVAFEKLERSIFVIEGMSSFELSSTVEDIRRNTKDANMFSDKSSSQVRAAHITVRFILLETPEHFEDLTRLSEHPLYWLRFQDKKFIHIRSYGHHAIQQMKKFLRVKSEIIYTQDDFLLTNLDTSDKKPVIIFDTPGMGKTTLLANMAYETKQRFPNRNVIFLRLPEMVDNLCLSEYSTRVCTIKQFLLNVLTTPNNMLAYEVQKALLDNPLHCMYLFLDGYDEIDLTRRGFAKEMLRVINEKFKIARIFISTRPHLSDELEEVFGVFGCKILPFQICDQVVFLTKYWEKKYSIEISSSVQDLANKCLATFKTNIPKDDRDIAGIPLQCRLVAELCSKYAKRESKYFSEDEFNVASMYDMCEQFLENMFAIHNLNLNYAYHIEKAIELIFPEEVIVCEWGLEIEQIYKIGVMEEGSNFKPKFIHRTFADFLVAKIFLNPFMLGNFKNMFKSSPYKFLFTNVLQHVDDATIGKRTFNILERRFLHTSLVYFLDSGFKNHSLYDLNLLDDIEKSNVSEIKSGDFFQKLLSCCLRSNLANLFRCIVCWFFDMGSLLVESNQYSLSLLFENSQLTNQVRHFEEKYRLSSLDYWEFLIIQASRFANLALLQDTCMLVQIITKKVFKELVFSNYKYNPIEYAANRGNFHIVEYLLSLSSNSFGSLAVYLCLEESYDNQESVVDEKISILKLFFHKYPELVKLLNRYQISPVLAYRSHLNLIKCLVTHGADMRIKTFNGKNNVAHLTAMYFNPEEFHELLQIASRNNFLSIFKKQNNDHLNPIHVALKYMDVQTETFDLLATYYDPNIWMNLSGFKYSHVLFHAVKHRRSVRVLEDILKIDPKAVKINNLLCYSILHNNVDAIKFFVCQGVNLNQRCCRFYTQTLLSHVLQCNNISRIKLVHLLIDNDADISQVFLDKGNVDMNNLSFRFRFMSPLSFAMKENLGVDLITTLKRKGAKERKFTCFCLSSITKLVIALIFWCLPISTYFTREYYNLCGAVMKPLFWICSYLCITIWASGYATVLFGIDIGYSFLFMLIFSIIGLPFYGCVL